MMCNIFDQNQFEEKKKNLELQKEMRELDHLLKAEQEKITILRDLLRAKEQAHASMVENKVFLGLVSKALTSITVS